MVRYPASKLPNQGVTIFTQMSALAADKGAINLSQGFPDYPAPSALLESAAKQIDAGLNQYAPLAGITELRQLIAAKIERLYGRRVDPDLEVTVTPGATEAIYSAITSVIRPGDEVILFDPAYDSYAPSVELNGGVPIHLSLLPPSFSVDWAAVRAAITPRTKMIITNTPHNPSGQVWNATDLAALESIVNGTDILIVADEVYEHLVYDGQTHQSVNLRQKLAERSFVISSFGKTYHVTGWRLGYCVAPKALTVEFRKVHQFVTFSAHTPLQYAIAEFGFFEKKRDCLAQGLDQSRFVRLSSQGTYFQLVDYTAISDMPDHEFVLWLVEHAGVAAIPLSPFYADSRQTGCVRLCFANETLTSSQCSIAVPRVNRLWCLIFPVIGVCCYAVQ